MLVQKSSFPYNGWSLFGVSLQASSDGIDGVFVGTFWKVDLMVWIDDCLQLLNKVKLGERCSSIDHFIEDTA